MNLRFGQPTPGLRGAFIVRQPDAREFDPMVQRYDTALAAATEFSTKPSPHTRLTPPARPSPSASGSSRMSESHAGCFSFFLSRCVCGHCHRFVKIFQARIPTVRHPASCPRKKEAEIGIGQRLFRHDKKARQGFAVSFHLQRPACIAGRGCPGSFACAQPNDVSHGFHHLFREDLSACWAGRRDEFIEVSLLWGSDRNSEKDIPVLQAILFDVEGIAPLVQIIRSDRGANALGPRRRGEHRQKGQSQNQSSQGFHGVVGLVAGRIDVPDSMTRQAAFS